MSTTGLRFHARLRWLAVALLALAPSVGLQADELPAAQAFKFADVDGIREQAVTVGSWSGTFGDALPVKGR